MRFSIFTHQHCFATGCETLEPFIKPRGRYAEKFLAAREGKVKAKDWHKARDHILASFTLVVTHGGRLTFGALGVISLASHVKEAKRVRDLCTNPNHMSSIRSPTGRSQTEQAQRRKRRGWHRTRTITVATTGHSNSPKEIPRTTLADSVQPLGAIKWSVCVDESAGDGVVIS